MENASNKFDEDIEHRLQRVQFFLGFESGQDDVLSLHTPQHEDRATCHLRLKSLLEILEQSKSKSQVIATILALCIFSTFHNISIC